MNFDKRWLQKELAKDLREKDRAKLGLLRAKIQNARIERRGMLRAARASCQTARAELKARQAVQRAEFVTAQRFERVVERQACSSGKESAKAKGAELETGARRSAKEEAIFQRQMRRGEKSAAVRQRARSTARERAEEDDDAVRSNIPAELRAVFDKVKRKIKGSPKRTRTEAFLDWAEENPDEIIAVQQEAADKELRELLKQQREFGRTVRSAGRYKHSPEELEQLLAEVPF